MKKTTWVFLYIKYSKFWSVLLEHFIERKPLFSEDCPGFLRRLRRPRRTITNQGNAYVSFNVNLYFILIFYKFSKKTSYLILITFFFRFRPIIPFESLTDLMNSSPRVSKLEAVLSHDEVDLLKQNYDLEIVEDLYYVL